MTSIFSAWTTYLLKRWQAAAAMLLVITLVLGVRRRSKAQNLDLPPSPKGLPLIGHLHLMPKLHPWIWYHQLAQLFGSSLTYLNLAGQDVVIVNDYQAAIDILEKRSVNYSSRPRLIVAQEYISSSKRIVAMPYGETWRRQRSAFQRDMTPQKAASYVPLISASCKVLMQALLRSPEQFGENFYRYSGGIMLKICYGLSDERECDNVVKDLTKIWEASLAAAVPGTNLVDLIPSLEYLPDFLSPWRRDAVRVRDETRRIFTDLVQHVQEKVATGQLASDQTFAGRLLQNKEKLRLDDLDLAFLTASIFEAGTDTTAASLSTFIMAAASYPSAFVAAQAEIERVCGDRPPTIDDMESLPLVKAVVKETMRWRPVVAGGVPHQATTTEDDYYNGMRIPAGALVIVNQYGIAMSQTMYGQKYNAEIFEPRRWTDRPEGVGDMFEANQGFGFGRRICPGRHLAVKTLFLAVANLCYWFDIRPKKGYSIDIHKFTSALVVHPEPFKCSIMPRAGRASHIEKEVEAALELLRNLSGY